MSQSQLEAVHALVRALNSSDIESIDSLLSEDATHRYMPRTMGPEAVGTRDKSGTLAVLKGTFEYVVQNMGIQVKEIVQGKDQVVILVDDNGVKKDGTPYFVEFVIFIRFTPGSDKISSIIEFQDSLYLSREFAGWYGDATAGL